MASYPRIRIMLPVSGNTKPKPDAGKMPKQPLAITTRKLEEVPVPVMKRSSSKHNINENSKRHHTKLFSKTI